MCIRARMETWREDTVMDQVAWLMAAQAGRIQGVPLSEAPPVLHSTLQMVYDQARQKTWKPLAHAILHGDPTSWAAEIDAKARYAVSVARWSQLLVRRAKQVMPDELNPEDVEPTETFVSTLLVKSMANEWVEEVVVRAALYLEVSASRLNWSVALGQVAAVDVGEAGWKNWPARPLLFTCLMVASKMADDGCWPNNVWASLLQQDTRTINAWERLFLSDGLEWNLHVNSCVYAVYKTSLVAAPRLSSTNDCVVQ